MQQGKKMFRIEVHNYIEQIISFFLRIGFWHRKQEDTVRGWRRWRLKIFYSIYYGLFPISSATGALISDNNDEKIFMVLVSVMETVMLVKLLHAIWTKREVLKLLNRICDFYVKDPETFSLIDEKLKDLMKFSVVFIILADFCATCIACFPFIGSEKKLFFSIGFPLDWRNAEYAYWIAVTFVFTQMILSAISVLFPVIVWYLLANCSFRYVVLGQQIRNMGKRGSVDGKANNRNTEKDNLFRRDLLQCIDSYNYLMEYESPCSVYTSS